jgi:hypothetical protein
MSECVFACTVKYHKREEETLVVQEKYGKLELKQEDFLRPDS